MYVVISHFEVANDKADLVREAFRNRPHLVEKAAGFVRMDVVSPLDNPAAFDLITCWQSKDSFETWHRSHAYRDAHQGIPGGLKLVAGSTSIRAYEHITS